MAKLIILGAGLTGLSCAYHLKKMGFKDFIIIEKEEQVGGFCRSLKKGSFIYDFTGHALHLQNEKVKDLIFHELGLKEKLGLVQREAFIFFQGKMIPYPFQMNLYYLPEPYRTNCLVSFLESALFSNKISNKFENFKDFCISAFGKEISRIFMIPYNKKLWNTNVEDLTTDWMGRFLPILPWKEVVRCTLSACNTKVGYNSSFYYPKKDGIGILPNAFVDRGELQKHILTGCKVAKLNPDGKYIETHKGKKFYYEYLVSTIPLKTTLESIEDFSNANLLKATTVKAYIIATQKNKFNFTWLYLPEETFTAYRIGNFSKFSTYSNSERDLLYVEVSSKTGLFYDDLTEKVLADVKKISGDTQLEVIDVLNITPAYCIYDKIRNKVVANTVSMLKKHGVFSTGRYGAWKYDSMEGAIIDGINVAETVLKHMR